MDNRILIPRGWNRGKGGIISEAIVVMKYNRPGEYVLQDQPLRDAGGRYAVVTPHIVLGGKNNLIQKSYGTGEWIPPWWGPYGSFHRFAVEFALKTGRDLGLWIRDLQKVPLNVPSPINDMFFLKPDLVLKVGKPDPRDGPTKPREINMWNFPLNIAYDSLRGYHGDGMRQASRAMRRRRRRLPYAPPERDQTKLG